MAVAALMAACLVAGRLLGGTWRRGWALVGLCWIAAVATVAVLAWIVYEITAQAMPSIRKFGLGFLSETRWVPNRDLYGVFPFLLGTAISSVMVLRPEPDGSGAVRS